MVKKSSISRRKTFIYFLIPSLFLISIITATLSDWCFVSQKRKSIFNTWAGKKQVGIEVEVLVKKISKGWFKCDTIECFFFSYVPSNICKLQATPVRDSSSSNSHKCYHQSIYTSKKLKMFMYKFLHFELEQTFHAHTNTLISKSIWQNVKFSI